MESLLHTLLLSTTTKLKNKCGSTLFLNMVIVLRVRICATDTAFFNESRDAER